MTSPIRSLALASALLAVLAACSKPEQPQMPPPEVVVMTATPKDVPLQRDLVGRLSPYRSSDVRARVAGVVQKRVYQEGSAVKEGQVLFLIDPAPLQASLSAAQANLASAQATYANAKVAADRARQLAPQKFVSKSDLDNAEAAERSAAAAVQQARANVETARINLGYASVTAPIAGRAGKQQVTEGALVGQGDTTLLTTINQIDPLYANFSMSSSELQAIQQAQGEGKVELASAGQRTVQIVLPNGRALDRTGTLDFSDTVVDPATGSVSLRATVPNADRTLLPGTFVTLRATLGEQKGAFLIPQGAIQRDTVSAYAMIVGKDGNVVRKNVVTQQAVGADWLVTEGLAAGDQVIVEGLQKVKEGAPAKGVTAEQAAAAKAAQAKPAPTQGKAE